MILLRFEVRYRCTLNTIKHTSISTKDVQYRTNKTYMQVLDVTPVLSAGPNESEICLHVTIWGKPIWSNSTQHYLVLISWISRIEIWLLQLLKFKTAANTVCPQEQMNAVVRSSVCSITIKHCHVLSAFRDMNGTDKQGNNSNKLRLKSFIKMTEISENSRRAYVKMCKQMHSLKYGSVSKWTTWTNSLIYGGTEFMSRRKSNRINLNIKWL